MRLKHKKNIIRPKKWTKFKYFWIAVGVFFVSIILGIYMVFRETKPKYTIAVFDDPDVKLIVLDITQTESYEFVIPGDTSVRVARDLGVLKLKNVYKLSQNETGTGEILAETVRNNFYVPVYYWSDGSLDEVINGSLIAKIKSLIGVSNNNLSLKERLHVLWFASILKPYQKSTVDISQTGVLAEATLTDGSDGFKIVRDFPDRLVSVFAQDGSRVDEVRLNDLSDDPVQDSVSKITQVLGARIALVTQEEGIGDFYCRVTGTGIRARELANTLDCSLFFKPAEDPFSIELELGKNFRL